MFSFFFFFYFPLTYELPEAGPLSLRISISGAQHSAWRSGLSVRETKEMERSCRTPLPQTILPFR